MIETVSDSFHQHPPPHVFDMPLSHPMFFLIVSWTILAGHLTILFGGFLTPALF